jgi:hypothetical protein
MASKVKRRLPLEGKGASERIGQNAQLARSLAKIAESVWPK